VQLNAQVRSRLANLSTQVPELRKIAIVGTSGAGKTSFAKALSQRLNLPHIELDELHWAPNWQEVPDEIFRERVSSATSATGWVTDGNYQMVRDIVWERVDAVVWLDYSFSLVMTRLFVRTMERIIKRTEIWHGNRETWQKQFFHRDSILWWGLSTFARRRREYAAIFNEKPYAHVHYIRFANPDQAAGWLQKLDSN
jgi:adenylate kinase family enzyme